MQIDIQNCNGYSFLTAYQVIKQLLAEDDRAKQHGNGHLNGTQIATLGGCMTILRHLDKAQQQEEHARSET